MVLSNTIWPQMIEKMKQRNSDYMVLDAGMYQYAKDRDRLDPGFNIVNLCNILRMFNESFEKAGIPKKIDFSIMGEALTSIYTNTPFDDEQLKEFFEFDRDIDKAARAMQSISRMTADFFVTGDVIQHIIGFGIDKQQEFMELDNEKYSTARDEFLEFYDKVVDETLPLDVFKKKGVEVMEKGLQQARERSSKV